jgi:hypothetical protein
VQNDIDALLWGPFAGLSGFFSERSVFSSSRSTVTEGEIEPGSQLNFQSGTASLYQCRAPGISNTPLPRGSVANAGLGAQRVGARRLSAALRWVPSALPARVRARVRRWPARPPASASASASLLAARPRALPRRTPHAHAAAHGRAARTRAACSRTPVLLRVAGCFGHDRSPRRACPRGAPRPHRDCRRRGPTAAGPPRCRSEGGTRDAGPRCVQRDAGVRRGLPAAMPGGVEQAVGRGRRSAATVPRSGRSGAAVAHVSAARMGGARPPRALQRPGEGWLHDHCPRADGGKQPERIWNGPELPQGPHRRHRGEEHELDICDLDYCHAGQR